MAAYAGEIRVQNDKWQALWLRAARDKDPLLHCIRPAKDILPVHCILTSPLLLQHRLIDE